MIKELNILLSEINKRCPEFGAIEFVFHQGQVNDIIVTDRQRINLQKKK